MLLTDAANDWDGEHSSMDHVGDKVASEGSRTLISLAERVAVVETKVGGLKEDTGVIRSTIHEIRNEMQQFVAAEMRCVASLEQLLGMKPHIEALFVDNQQGKGVWRAIGIVGTTLVGAATVGAGIASAVWWLVHVH